MSDKSSSAEQVSWLRARQARLAEPGPPPSEERFAYLQARKRRLTAMHGLGRCFYSQLPYAGGGYPAQAI